MSNRNWVSADGGGPGQIQTYQDPGPGVHIDVGGAYANIAPSTIEKTSAIDKAKGLILRSVPILILEFFLSLALVILAVMVLGVDAGAGSMLLGILLLWGVMGVASYLLLAERADWYSSPGVEHHRVDSATEVAVQQIQADRDVRLAALRSYMALLETQANKQDTKQIGGPLG